MKAITGCTLIDGTGRPPIPNSVVSIEGERIAEVGTRGEVALASGAEIIDGSGRYLLPGLIELHSHMYHPAMVGAHHPAEEPEAYTTLYAQNMLRQALQAGITTARDLSSPDFIDLSLKRAIDEGVVTGPRLFLAAKGIRVTSLGMSEVTKRYSIQVDGQGEIVETVRRLARKGVDLIKFFTSPVRGGDLDFTPEELGAGIGEAHRHGLRAAVHTWTLPGDKRVSDPSWAFPGVDIIVRAGADTLEHGAFLISDDALARMADQGTVWVPTCYVTWDGPRVWDRFLQNPNLPMTERRTVELYRKEADLHGERLSQSFAKALKAGVRIGTGADAISREHTYAAIPEEMEIFTQLGMTPMQAIESATRVGAEALGQEENLGTIEKGKYADLIMVDSDPLKDITALKNVTWVMKGGRVIPFSPEYGRLVGKAPWLTL